MANGMKSPRIVLTGTDAVEAVATLSEIEPDNAHCHALDKTGVVDPTTSVVLKHGVMRVERGGRIHLYGKPENVHADAVARLLRSDGIGLITLLNNKSQYPLRDMNFQLHTFQDFIASSSVAVGVMHSDPNDPYSIDDYQTELVQCELQAPVFDVDSRNYEDLVTLVEALLLSAAARRAVT